MRQRQRRTRYFFFQAEDGIRYLVRSRGLRDVYKRQALIALHKAIKKDEDKALQRVAASLGEQSVITKGANKFNDVRTTLDTRLNNAHSYLVLAGAISSTANSPYMLSLLHF